MSNLHLVLTYHWFDEMAAGRKDVEYRAATPYWQERIWEQRHELTTLTVARGYTSTTLARQITLIDLGPCPYPGWRGEYYRIHLAPIAPPGEADGGS